MKLTEEYNRLVKSVKDSVKAKGGKITNEQLAKKVGLTRTYFSSLLGGSEAVKEKHIEDFKAHFRDELRGIEKPAPAGDKLNRERALIKVLLHEVARLKSKDEKIPFAQALEELKQSTNLVLDDLDF